jgi:predicted DNA-binding transcriptional regulator YafY
MKARDKEQQRLVRLVRMLGDFDAAPAPLMLRDIAETYEVTGRTIQRDIALLRDAGFSFDEVAKGTYAFAAGQALKRVKLSEEEAALMTFFGDVASEMGGPFAKTFRSLAAKFLAEEYATAYGVKLPDTAKRGDFACATTLERCIDENRKAEIDYRKADGEKDYLLHPYKIVYCDGFWYVWGKNERDRKLATFRLDRITAARATDQYFTMEKDAARLLEEGVNVWMSGLRETRVLLAVDARAARYVEEKVFFPLQRILERHPDGSLTVESRISHEREILPSVFRWLPHVRILEPSELAARSRNMVSEYLSGFSAGIETVRNKKHCGGNRTKKENTDET